MKYAELRRLNAMLSKDLDAERSVKLGILDSARAHDVCYLRMDQRINRFALERMNDEEVSSFRTYISRQAGRAFAEEMVKTGVIHRHPDQIDTETGDTRVMHELRFLKPATWSENSIRTVTE